MENLWREEQARTCKDDLDLRVYTSRLLGQDATLVLHGGGNTSVKITERNLLGESEEVLYVKGSGWDLATIERPGFAPVKMSHLLKLAKLERLSDPQMVNELKTHTTIASAPTPSVEAILHAILPYKFVDHTHADSIVTITNTPGGKQKIQEIYGDTMVLVDYCMPGFDLARVCAVEFERQRNPRTIGMILLNHGIFTFGDTAKQSYDRMIEQVGKAEQYIQSKNAWQAAETVHQVATQALRVALATLRKEISSAAGATMLLCRDDSAKAAAFIARADIATVSQQGPATPDHVIRTKRLPMVGRDVARYQRDYKIYFDAHAPKAKEPKTMLDSAPRVVLDPELGLLGVGRSAKDACIVLDIYDHTIDVISRAAKLGGYQALPAQDIFDVEYWDLEQAKLRGGGKPPLFAGEVALVTGAASGIGKACVEALLARGAAVIGVDLNPAIETLFRRQDFCGVVADVSDEEQLINALEIGVRAFGGLDILVLNAGIFPGGCPMSELDLKTWRKVMAINVDGNVALLREAHPLLKLSPRCGRVVFIASKNVLAPGPGAAAYSASKAALTQLARIAALEWGKDKIRINVLHPDAVYDTGLWTDEVLAARAKHYGMSVADYKARNVLKAEVTSMDVANLAAEMCGPLFAKTTGVQIAIDGGNERVI